MSDNFCKNAKQNLENKNAFDLKKMIRPQKLHALTSLRFFAAAMIVLGHAHPVFGSMQLANIFSLSQGVSFFFVLSGFILAYNYPVFSKAEEFFVFFRARIARIWPVHVAAIGLLFVLTGGLPLGTLTGNEIGFAAIANIFLFQSVIPLRDVFLTFNGVAWSISTEMFFYIAFPLLVTNAIFGWRIKLLFLLLIVGLYLWFVVAWAIPSDESSSSVNLMGLLYVNPLVRLIEFFVGILACMVFKTLNTRLCLPSRYFTIAEILAIVFTLLSMHFSHRVLSLLGLQGDLVNVLTYYLTKVGSFWIFAFLIIIFAFGRGSVSKVLSIKPMVLLGEISFSLYLVHTTVLQWYELNRASFASVPEWGRSLAYWALSLLVAYMLHKTIEIPCRKLIVASPMLTPRQGARLLFSGKQGGHVAFMIVMLGVMMNSPSLLKQSVQSSSYEKDLLNQHQLSTPAVFGEYMTLRAMHLSQDRSNPEADLDLLFRVDKAVPVRYKIAVHIVDDNKQIVEKTDIAIAGTDELLKGDQWVASVKLPSAWLTKGAGLGVAIYSAQELLPVAYSKTDYDGHRALFDY